MKRAALRLAFSSLVLFPLATSCSSSEKDGSKDPVSETTAPDAPPSQLPEQPASDTTPPPSTEMAPAEKKHDKKLDHRKHKSKKKPGVQKSTKSN